MPEECEESESETSKEETPDGGPEQEEPKP